MTQGFSFKTRTNDGELAKFMVGIGQVHENTIIITKTMFVKKENEIPDIPIIRRGKTHNLHKSTIIFKTKDLFRMVIELDKLLRND